VAATLLTQVHGAGKTAAAWVNHPRTRMLRDDLDALVAPALHAILIPHATEPQDVRDAAVLLREFEYTRGIEPGTVAVFPVIDSARGLLRAAEIAQAAPRVGGLVFDGAAYARDIAARDEEHGPRFAHARGLVVAAARAVDGLPLVKTNAFELLQLANMGFAGAILPDEHGAASANAAFSPTAAQVAYAREQLAAYESAKSAGDWVARLGSEVVDAASLRKAKRLLEQAAI
jgi:citrate lyase subunit beta/citryl-CoA lyase